jgi:hypothetical protein
MGPRIFGAYSIKFPHDQMLYQVAKSALFFSIIVISAASELSCPHTITSHFPLDFIILKSYYIKIMWIPLGGP